MQIQPVKSRRGIEAWLVEEHGLPMIALQFAFLGGASQDPGDRPGVANLLTTMLDEGAGEQRAEEFQARLADNAIKLRFDAGRDLFTGTLQTLTQNLAEAVMITRLVLTRPRFDADALERMRDSVIAAIQIARQHPDEIAQEAWFRTAFPEHPYGRPVDGTLESVPAISAQDLRDYVGRVFTRDNLKIGIVGDIDAAGVERLIDDIFGDLPESASRTVVPTVAPRRGPSQQVIEMDVRQSVVQFGGTGILRRDADFIPAFVLNHIIGGGGFSSRLMEEVREKRGLAYSVYSSLQSYRNSAIYVGGVATKNEAVATSLEVIRNELQRIASDGPSDDELEDAKKFLTGSYALRFNSSTRIASQMVGTQVEDLGIDYFDRRNALVEAVTIADIRRVADRYLKPDELLVTVVGKPVGL